MLSIVILVEIAEYLENPLDALTIISLLRQDGFEYAVSRDNIRTILINFFSSIHSLYLRQSLTKFCVCEPIGVVSELISLIIHKMSISKSSSKLKSIWNHKYQNSYMKPILPLLLDISRDTDYSSNVIHGVSVGIFELLLSQCLLIPSLHSYIPMIIHYMEDAATPSLSDTFNRMPFSKIIIPFALHSELSSLVCKKLPYLSELTLISAISLNNLRLIDEYPKPLDGSSVFLRSEQLWINLLCASVLGKNMNIFESLLLLNRNEDLMDYEITFKANLPLIFPSKIFIDETCSYYDSRIFYSKIIYEIFASNDAARIEFMIILLKSNANSMILEWAFAEVNNTQMSSIFNFFIGNENRFAIVCALSCMDRSSFNEFKFWTNFITDENDMIVHLFCSTSINDMWHMPRWWLRSRGIQNYKHVLLLKTNDVLNQESDRFESFDVSILVTALRNASLGSSSVALDNLLIQLGGYHNFFDSLPCPNSNFDGIGCVVHILNQVGNFNVLNWWKSAIENTFLDNESVIYSENVFACWFNNLFIDDRILQRACIFDAVDILDWLESSLNSYTPCVRRKINFDFPIDIAVTAFEKGSINCLDWFSSHRPSIFLSNIFNAELKNSSYHSKSILWARKNCLSIFSKIFDQQNKIKNDNFYVHDLNEIFHKACDVDDLQVSRWIERNTETLDPASSKLPIFLIALKSKKIRIVKQVINTYLCSQTINSFNDTEMIFALTVDWGWNSCKILDLIATLRNTLGVITTKDTFLQCGAIKLAVKLQNFFWMDWIFQHGQILLSNSSNDDGFSIEFLYIVFESLLELSPTFLFGGEVLYWLSQKGFFENEKFIKTQKMKTKHLQCFYQMNKIPVSFMIREVMWSEYIKLEIPTFVSALEKQFLDLDLLDHWNQICWVDYCTRKYPLTDSNNSD